VEGKMTSFTPPCTPFHQAALEHSYGAAAASAAAAALSAGLVSCEGALVGREELFDARLQARMLVAVQSGNLGLLKEVRTAGLTREQQGRGGGRCLSGRPEGWWGAAF
jgi:hypothetical protein